MVAASYARLTVNLKMADEQLQNGVMSVDSSYHQSASSVPTENTFLGCSLCKKFYSEPKILPCLHTFCWHCLDASTPPHSLSIMCPSCRQQSIVPPEGVAGLQDSGFVLRLMDFVERCQKCSECTASPSATCAEHSQAREQDLAVLPLVGYEFCHRLKLYHRPLKIRTDGGRARLHELGSIGIFFSFLL